MANKENKINPKVIILIILCLVIIRVFGACAENAFKIPGLELFPDLIDWLKNPFKQSDELEYESDGSEDFTPPETIPDDSESLSYDKESASDVEPGEGSGSTSESSGGGNAGEDTGDDEGGKESTSAGGNNSGGNNDGDEGEGNESGSNPSPGGSEPDDGGNESEGGSTGGDNEGGNENESESGSTGGNENESESDSSDLESDSESVNVDYISTEFELSDIYVTGDPINVSYNRTIDHVTVNVYILNQGTDELPTMAIDIDHPLEINCEEEYILVKVILECVEGNFELEVDVGQGSGQIVNGEYVWTWEWVYEGNTKTLIISNTRSYKCRINKMTIITALDEGN